MPDGRGAEGVVGLRGEKEETKKKYICIFIYSHLGICTSSFPNTLIGAISSYVLLLAQPCWRQTWFPWRADSAIQSLPNCKSALLQISKLICLWNIYFLFIMFQLLCPSLDSITSEGLINAWLKKKNDPNYTHISKIPNHCIILPRAHPLTGSSCALS